MADEALIQEMSRWNRIVCIHGHFYQPPRENPWLELIEVQDSAAPYHDWNELVCAECYAPNTQARIVDNAGKVRQMINNYEWISFNIGPTLLAWLEQYAPKVLQAIQEADRRSIDRCFGHGNAIAQAYNHIILPLASRRDKILQVRWGIEVFRHYFQRDPEGMWLPETAVDTETLEVLADQGIVYTILSPRQAAKVRPSPDQPWFDISGNHIDTRRPYRCCLPSGQQIILLFYDGEVAQEVAFQRLLTNGEDFFQRILSRFNPENEETQLVHIATDGETFGHHHKFGEMALAYFISHQEKDSRIHMTNYGHFLAANPPVWEVKIVEQSSWSCIHGVERWQSDCGCHTSGSPTHQRWRAPLRGALNNLKQKADALFESQGCHLFDDPWQALDAYIHVLLNRADGGVRQFFLKMKKNIPLEQEVVRALELLEMQRHAQLMFTSCGWFFDDLSGIETVQILRFAARVIQLTEENFKARWETDFLNLIETAPSNYPATGNGKALWDKEVKPMVTDLERVLAHFAISMIFRKDISDQVGFSYSFNILDSCLQEAGQAHFALGAAEVFSHVLFQKAKDIYAVIHFGGLDVQFFRKTYSGTEDYEALKKELVTIFQEGSLGDLYQRLLHYFQQPTHQLKDLFLDEQRRIIEIILKERVDDYQVLFEQFLEQDHILLKQLGILRYPIPEPMRMTAKIAAERRIRRHIELIESDGDLQPLIFYLEQAKQWRYRPEGIQWERFFLLRLEKHLQALWAEGDVPAILRKLEGILKAADLLEIPLNLWNIQNLYVEICTGRSKVLQTHRNAIKAFAVQINMNPEVLPPDLR